MKEFCKNCGNQLHEGAKFCPDCGTKVENTPLQLTNDVDYCPNCGKTVDNDYEFCPDCGTNLISQEPTKHVSILEKYKIPIIIIALLAIIGIIIFGALSMTQTGPVDVGTQTVSVGAHEFEIPGDCIIDPSTVDVDYNGYSAIFSQAYSNSYGELIDISVMTIPYNVDGEEVAASQGGVYKNMMGVNGYYIEDNGVYTFAFVDGTYLNVVSASSPYLLDEITYLG